MEELNQDVGLRVGYTPAFPLVSLESLIKLKEELGLFATPHRLSLMQKQLWKQSNRYTFDEIYAADAYINTANLYYSDILIHSAEIEKAEAGEAFSDLMSKYKALGRTGAPSLDELPSIYNA